MNRISAKFLILLLIPATVNATLSSPQSFSIPNPNFYAYSKSCFAVAVETASGYSVSLYTVSPTTQYASYVFNFSGPSGRKIKGCPTNSMLATDQYLHYSSDWTIGLYTLNFTSSTNMAVPSTDIVLEASFGSGNCSIQLFVTQNIGNSSLSLRYY